MWPVATALSNTDLEDSFCQDTLYWMVLLLLLDKVGVFGWGDMGHREVEEMKGGLYLLYLLEKNNWNNALYFHFF